MDAKQIVQQFLEEALIVFNNKPYPKFGNILLMAGGAGSGKGFSLEKLIGLEGKVVDVDAMKQMAMKSQKILQRVKDELHIDMSKMSLKKPENVSKLHHIIADELHLDSRLNGVLVNAVMSSDKSRLPNIIFDKTMKSEKHIKQVSDFAKLAGYDLKNCHIVWVVTDIDVAIEQNKKRSRTVPEDILKDTHTGVSSFMNYVINEIPDDIRQYMDGDIYISFNTAGVDSTILKSNLGGMFIKAANYIKIKSSGKPIDKSKVTDEVVKRIRSYVPNKKVWD